MKIVNIIKPDMLSNAEAIDEYINKLKMVSNIEYCEYYKISDWANASKFIYEYNLTKTDGMNKAIIERNLLNSIMGYYILYKNYDGVAIIINFKSNPLETYNKLHIIKKDIRKKYAYSGPQYYINYLCDPGFKEKLSDYDLSAVSCEISLNKNGKDGNYIFLNYLHSPDDEQENTFEYTALNDLKTFSKVKKLCKIKS